MRNTENHARRPPIPVTVVGGFLGAGKTSLLNHLLTHSRSRRIAALVNDFGEINIDARLIVSIEGEKVSLANGCVCCTIRDDLLIEVQRLVASRAPPEQIVIETSGVSRPLSVAETFFHPSVRGIAELQSLICVLDADLVVAPQAVYANLAYEQIRSADLVVINKTDLVHRAQVAALKEQVRRLVPRARIWETAFGQVPLPLLWEPSRSVSLRYVRASADKPDEGHHDELAAWTYRSDTRWSFGALHRAIESLHGDVYRAKGFIRLALPGDQYGVLQLTGRRSWLRLCQPELDQPFRPATEIVFVGRRGTLSEVHIRAHFDRVHAEARQRPNHRVKDLRAFTVVFV